MSRVRVRIAPSPTGSPHVGTAYIALFNYCFAKSLGGDFLLRIEDTDQNRSRPEYEEMILQALRWVGLSWDEGPDVGGPCGPYRQSERTEIYQRHAEILLASGHAYKCFCTQERLEALRLANKGVGEFTGYDGHCASLSAEERTAREAEGLAFTVRLRVPNYGTIQVIDRLRGEIQFELKTVDHQVLLKSDGYPTYHLANVVDDHLMGITHVLRGEEWLSSLPKHILLYQAFGWQPPEVIHLPLLRNEDSSKLSKRKNPTSILYYRELGILPEALLNFLGMMAYTLPSGEELFSLEEMVKSFDVSRVHLGGPIFDLQKLRWVNSKHIAKLDGEGLLQRLLLWKLNPEYLGKIVPMMTERMHYLGDFMQFCDFMFYSEVQYAKETLLPKKRELDETRDYLQKLIWELETVSEFAASDLERAVQKTGSIQGWSLRDAAHAARVAICGKTVAPPLFEVMAILGSDICRNRLMQAVKELGPLGKKKLEKLQEDYAKASREWVAPENAGGS